MADIRQIEQKYQRKRQQIEREYEIKLQELAEDNPGILRSILYEGKSKQQVEKVIKQELADDLDQLAYDKARDTGEVE